MISFEDRMALVRAGYTASQIAEFDTNTAPEPEPKPEPEPEPQQEPQQEPQPTDLASMMQSINNSMAAMLAAMQAQNIKTADMREPEKETPGDILAKLLNPEGGMKHERYDYQPGSSRFNRGCQTGHRTGSDGLHHNP